MEAQYCRTDIHVPSNYRLATSRPQRLTQARMSAIGCVLCRRKTCGSRRRDEYSSCQNRSCKFASSASSDVDSRWHQTATSRSNIKWCDCALHYSAVRLLAGELRCVRLVVRHHHVRPGCTVRIRAAGWRFE